MDKFVVFSRDINVCGNNTLPMKELISILKNLGCEDVKTYIQSGNVVFSSIGISAQDIENTIESKKGFVPGS